jgi:transcriptional regulatory protein RtcR
MATLAEAGRITEDIIQEEIVRLRATWSDGNGADASADILGDRADALDLFDRCQLNAVIAVCRSSASLSEAGRRLFAVSRQDRKQANDADRLRKYLGRFGLRFDELLIAGAGFGNN